MKLKDAGFTIVGLVRNPRKQLQSLIKLLPQNEPENSSRLTIMFCVGWSNLIHYFDTELMDYYINSEEYLSNAFYRKTIHKQLGLNITEVALNNMTRYLGKDFHNICAIISSWDNNTDPSINKWNAYASSSTRLNVDTSKIIQDENIPSNLVNKIKQVEEFYKLFLKRC